MSLSVWRDRLDSGLFFATVAFWAVAWGFMWPFLTGAPSAPDCARPWAEPEYRITLQSISAHDGALILDNPPNASIDGVVIVGSNVTVLVRRRELVK